MMASEDVIELGSSDEESEPAPKKANISKRRPNAMVQFPPGVTIKHAKPANHNINPIRKLISKGLTVTKVNTTKPISTNVRNGKPPSKPIKLPQIQNIKSINPIPIPVPRLPVLNPLNMAKKLNTPAMVSFPNSSPYHPIRVQNAKSIKNLPPSITVTKKPGPGVTIAGSKPALGKFSGGRKRPAATSVSNVKKKQKLTPEPPITVNLDDEEVPTTSTASPQWYLKPEDATDPLKELQHHDELSMEKQNNTEPKQFVEITIEDSPIKPVHNKRTHEIGAELAITIDDSPVKLVASKATKSADSDNDNPAESPKEKQSKKKLEYPGEVCQYVENTTIEIELEPINNDIVCEYNDASQKSDEVIINEENKKEKKEAIYKDIVIEVFESPAKTVQTPPSTPKKVEPLIQKIKPIAITAQPLEFHPVYQEFIDLCLKLENSNDMNTIVEKKIKSYYRQVPKEYTESEEFVELVQSKLLSMKAGPEKLYLYIKDIVDELNLQRKMAKAKPTLKEASNIEAEKFQYGEESEFDLKRQRQIRKLEKTLKKLHRAIQKLEEQEVDFDDEEDSVYLLTESDDSSSSIKDLDRQLERERSVLLKRYKERMVRVHAKFCQLTNTKMPSEPRIQIQARPGQPDGPAKRLEKWVNKKVPIGKPLPFPDFHDVLKCVRDANNEDKLGWNEAEIMEEARDLFTRCGKKLQRRRQENEWRLAASRISLEADPAENSEDLKKKLESNKQVAANKETDVFNKFADKQSQMKLEAIEINDKEADESPIESEDDEPQEESSTLENKEKRKERLRRLIHEKSKKTEEKERESKVVLPSDEKATNEDDSKSNKNDAEKEETKEIDIEVDKSSVQVDSVSQDLSTKTSNSIEKAHSVSGDSKVDSDVDELHLLQKLHSDEVNTSVDSTDSDSPIDISDTLTSSDNKKPLNSDVISIENSSYSETESKDGTTTKIDIKETGNEIIVPESLSGEIECSYAGIQLNKTNNQEYNESVESILLATTDEEDDDTEKDENSKRNDQCVNLKDDDISIGETVVEKIARNKIAKESSNRTSKLLSIEDIEINRESSKETSVKCKESTEEDNKLLNEVELNSKNDAIAEDRELIDEIHSIESVDSSESTVQAVSKDSTSTVNVKRLEVSDNHSAEKLESDNGSDHVATESGSVVLNEQKSHALKNISVAVSKNARDVNIENEKSNVTNNPFIKTLGSDNSQEIVNEDEDALMTDIQELDRMETVVTTDSDNSKIAAKEKDMKDKQPPEIIENTSVETIESDNSQEMASTKSENTTGVEEMKEEHSKSVKDRFRSITAKKSIEIQEITDSNDQPQYRHKHELGAIELNESKKLDSDCPDDEGTKTLDCLLDDQITPDEALNDKLT